MSKQETLAGLVRQAQDVAAPGREVVAASIVRAAFALGREVGKAELMEPVPVPSVLDELEARYGPGARAA
jgi:hypothetical protein